MAPHSKTRVALSTVLGLMLAALSGVLLTLAFPPYNIWPLVFVGFAPAVVAQHRVMPRRLSGLAYGVAFGAFYWGYFGPMFVDLVWYMAWLPLIVGVIATLLSGGDRAFNERTRYKWFVLSGAMTWVAIEAIRGFAPVIGTGGSVAYALYSQPWFIQPVGIFGIFGLGLLVMLVNYLFALGLIALMDARLNLSQAHEAIPPGLVRGWIVAVVIALVAWSGLSVSLIGQASVPGSLVRIAAVQTGLQVSQAERTEKLFALTRQAAAQGARLVVWPEGALSFDPQMRRTEEFRALAREIGAYISISYGVRTSEGLRNETTMVGPDGEFLGVYGKDHPVVWMGETSLTHGSYPVYETPFGALGTIICYDLNFTDTARNFAARGAQLIAVGSNDWSSLAHKQYTNLVMRAVENRVTLIKADSYYDSAVIDPTGFVLSRSVSVTPQEALLLADVPIGKADTLLIRLGDWAGWVCIAGIIAFTVISTLTGRRARKPEGTEKEPSTTQDQSNRHATEGVY